MKKNSKAYPKKEWNVLELTKIAHNIPKSKKQPSGWKNDQWFADLCQHMNKKNIQCDQLLISGHYSSTWHSEKENGLNLNPYTMLKYSCNPKYKCNNIFKNPSEILLLGCNTFTGSEDNKKKCTTKEIERRVNRYTDEFHMYNRYVAEEVVASQCLNFNITNRELFKSMFSGRIHGFDGTAPLGKNYASTFRDQWVNKFSNRIKKSKLSLKCESNSTYNSPISHYHACRKTFKSMQAFDQFLQRHVSNDLVPNLPLTFQNSSRHTRKCLGKPITSSNPLCELVHSPDNPESPRQQLNSIERKMRGAANLFYKNPNEGVRRIPLITKALDEIENFFGTSLEKVCTQPEKYPGRQIDNICIDFEYLSSTKIKKATLLFLQKKELSSLPSVKLKLIRFYQQMGWKPKKQERQILKEASSQTLNRMLNKYSVDYFDRQSLDTFMRLKDNNIYPQFDEANEKIFKNKFHINTLRVLEELAGGNSDNLHNQHKSQFRTFKVIPYCRDGSTPKKSERIYKCKKNRALKKKVIISKSNDLYSLIAEQRLKQMTTTDENNNQNILKDLKYTIFKKTNFYSHPLKLSPATVNSLNKIAKSKNRNLRDLAYRAIAETGDLRCDLNHYSGRQNHLKKIEDIACSKKSNSCSYCSPWSNNTDDF